MNLVAFVNHGLSRVRVCQCGGKRKCNINGSQGLESQTHLKWAMASGTMESPIVNVLEIWESLVPCMWIIRILHVHNVHNHLIDDLYLAIGLGLESSGFCDLDVQQRPKTRPKCAKEPIVSVGDDGVWYPKVDPHSFKEELESICHCDILHIGGEDGHL
jgi:hypothetical protein